MSEKVTQCNRIIAGLREGPKRTDWFIDVLRIFKYSSRIADLRKKGYLIKATKLGPSLWEYELLAEPDTKVPEPPRVAKDSQTVVPPEGPRQSSLFDLLTNERGGEQT